MQLRPVTKYGDVSARTPTWQRSVIHTKETGGGPRPPGSWHDLSEGARQGCFSVLDYVQNLERN